MQRFKHGFLLGKFMPLHTGHIYLVETALPQCEKLTILVTAMASDPIPPDLRVEWVKKQFPEANVVHDPDELPRDQSGVGFWDMWRDSIRTYCPDDYDAVFSSEKYGDRLAQELGAIHVAVDPARTTVPISATDIRNDPKKHWEYIPEIVRPYYE